MVGSFDISSSVFSRNLHTYFHNGCTSSHQSAVDKVSFCGKVFVSLVSFLDNSHSDAVRWNLSRFKKIIYSLTLPPVVGEAAESPPHQWQHSAK